MIKYKIDVMSELSKRGYSSSVIREKKWLSQATMTNIRKGEHINTNTLNILCVLLRCQPNDILEVVPSDEEKIKYY